MIPTLKIDFSLDEIKEYTPEMEKRQNELKDMGVELARPVNSNLKDELDSLQHLEAANLYKRLATDDKHPEYDADNNIRARKSYARYLIERQLAWLK